MIHDPDKCRLGKRAAVHPKGLHMMSELIQALPDPPSAVAWYKGINKLGVNVPAITKWPMDGNDSLGDCTIAAVSHLIQLWTTATGTPVIPTDEQVIAEYSRLCGYVVGDPSTDQGGVESDILKAWQDGGIFGHKIDGFVGVNPSSVNQIKDAVFYFGGAYIGVELPNSAQDQTVWDVPAGGLSGDGAPGSWGGHAIPIVGAGSRGITVVTWGGLKQATWEFLQAYCDEAYALLSNDWITKASRIAGAGFEANYRVLVNQ